ncbi:MAG: RsmE family RNA methyltransferase [bacterium]|nr:RsmE family RNA methyltransferase [bacterium]
MPVFLIKNHPDPTGFFSLDQETLHHLRDVLRLGSGDPFQISLPDGCRAKAELVYKEQRWKGRVLEMEGQNVSPLLPLEIGVGMIRWPSLEWLVQKSAELGIEKLSLLILKHGKYSFRKPVSPQKIARLVKISCEAMKQCEGLRPPEISSPRELKPWLESTAGHRGPKLLFLERSAQLPRGPDLFQKGKPHLFAFGPEGGFAGTEIELLEKHGFIPVSLGPRILKTETALLVAISLFDAFYQANP